LLTQALVQPEHVAALTKSQALLTRRIMQAITDRLFGASLLSLAAVIFSYYTLWVVITVRQ
jgi:hypothetical protein